MGSKNDLQDSNWFFFQKIEYFFFGENFVWLLESFLGDEKLKSTISYINILVKIFCFFLWFQVFILQRYPLLHLEI
jgi:hypothetical protein